jgi:hypothetical protein
LLPDARVMDSDAGFVVGGGADRYAVHAAEVADTGLCGVFKKRTIRHRSKAAHPPLPMHGVPGPVFLNGLRFESRAIPSVMWLMRSAVSSSISVSSDNPRTRSPGLKGPLYLRLSFLPPRAVFFILALPHSSSRIQAFFPLTQYSKKQLTRHLQYYIVIL